MTTLEEFKAFLATQQQPECAKLTPFEVTYIEPETALVRVEFAPQPAFQNFYGVIAGGYGVAMIDGLVTLSALLALQQWAPTVEIKSSFLAPAKLGVCVGEARVLKAGKNLAFFEAKLWGADGQLAIHATATVSVRSSA